MKPLTRAQQVENLRVAYSIMAGVPAKRINLWIVRKGKDFAEDKGLPLPECGTAACVAGWLSAHPYFQAQGLRFSTTEREISLGPYGLFGSANYLFGTHEVFSGGSDGMTGKLQALERIRRALREKSALSHKRDCELHRYEDMLTS